MELQYIYINNTKIANVIRRKNDFANKRNILLTGKRGSEIETAFWITHNLSAYDCAVADAIYTLYKGEYRRFSIRQILQVLSGDTEQTLTDTKRTEIVESIERLRLAKIKIDCTQEMYARRVLSREDEICILEGNFLNIDDAGKKYCLNHLKDIPLYRYAEMNKQMIAVPPELLCIYTTENGKRKKLSDTRETILVKRYLIQRLEIMRNPRNSANGRKISYYWEDASKSHASGMLNDLQISMEECSSEAAKRHKFLRIHNSVIKILEYYKNDLHYIEDYEVRRGARGTIKGVEIIGNIKPLYTLYQEDPFA